MKSLSNETKNILSRFWSWVVLQIEHKNYLPLIIMAVGSWYAFVYVHDYIEAKLEGNERTTMFLIQELEKVKQAQKDIMNAREAGHVGITYH